MNAQIWTLYWNLTNALKLVGLCFGHAMLEVTQYAIDDAKVYYGLSKYVWKLFKHHCKKLLFGQKN
jgi:hypothetical protein